MWCSQVKDLLSKLHSGDFDDNLETMDDLLLIQPFQKVISNLQKKNEDPGDTTGASC